jgi:hypothetical protein
VKLNRDENGIAVPFESHPLPWKAAWGTVADANDDEVCQPGEQDGFICHAANYHFRMAYIVRTSAQWNESGIPHVETLLKFISDSAKLWDEMSRDQ